MVEPEQKTQFCGYPDCPGHDGLENLTVPELIATLETRKAMLVWAILLYPSVGTLRSVVN